MKEIRLARGVWLLLSAGLLIQVLPLQAAADELPKAGLFARSNLVAWCIVPFDAKKRGPEERAQMLERLGFKFFAYDYRAEHIPSFEAEIQALQRHRIILLAWWFPTTLNEEAKLILNLLKRQELRPQLWVMGGGELIPTGNANAEAQRGRVESEAERIQPIAEAAAKIGCKVGLYNHGGWFGEPENQLAILEKLRGLGIRNVGLVYNLHHGHAHIRRFPELMKKMKPDLLALNLNGMDPDGETSGRQILPLGEGKLDLTLLQMIEQSGWRGPIGILNHTDEDAEARLQENLHGLARLASQLVQQRAAGAEASTPSK